MSHGAILLRQRMALDMVVREKSVNDATIQWKSLIDNVDAEWEDLGCLLGIPEHTTSDYVKIVYLALLFLSGCCVNLVAAERLSRATKHYCGCENLRNTMMHSLHRIKCHVNVADLNILLLYCLTEICWLVTYSWRAGEIACRCEVMPTKEWKKSNRLIQFGRTFAFYASSNLTVCIALNRYFSIYPPRIRLVSDQNQRTTFVLTAAWSLAVLCSTPQLFAWTVVRSDMCNGGVWEQCANVWDGWSDNDNNTWWHLVDWALVYQVYHLSFVFWLPLVAIVAIYAMLIVRIHSAKRMQEKATIIVTPCNENDVNVRMDVTETMSPKSVVSINVSNSTTIRKAPTASTSSAKQIATNTSACVHTANVLAQAQHVAIRTSTIVVAVYVLSYLPYSTLQIAKALFGYEWYAQATQASDWLNALIVIHSVINPFLYGAFSAAYDFGYNYTDVHASID